MSIKQIRSWQWIAVWIFLALPTSVTKAHDDSTIADTETTTNRWTSFRNGGSSSVPDAAKLPVRWSAKEGIAWQAELPGYGQSSPVLLGERVFITAVKGDQKEKNLIVCLNRKSGQAQWVTETESSLKGASNYMYSRAAPTPVVDHSMAYGFFESGDLIAVDFETGQIRWKRDIKEMTNGFKSRHGLGSSLAANNTHLFLNLEHDGPSFLIAIDKTNGKTAWKVSRPSGSSWSSPAIMRWGKQEYVVVSSAGQAIAVDAKTGDEVWRVDGLAGNSVASPLVSKNKVYLGARKPEFGNAETAAKSNLCLEIKPNSNTPKVKWRSQRCMADYASPVIIDRYLFLIDGNGILGCLDRESGQEIYRKRLGFKCWATPIVCGDHLFLFGKNGTTKVVEVGPKFKCLHENYLWDVKNPPAPTSYKEYFAKSGSNEDGHSSRKPAKPGESMLRGMMKNDSDQDGVLSGDEIPKRLLGVMDNIDLNQDKRLDQGELKKMAASFAAKRKGSKNSSRDPIVYGVAADHNGILVRTGTRLFAIDGEVKE